MKGRVVVLLASCFAVAACTGGGSSSSAGPSQSPSSESGAESGAGSGAGSPSPSGSAATPPEAPPRGACYRMSLESAARTTSEASPVPCQRPHTTLTIRVGTLEPAAKGRPVAVESARVQRQLRRSCVPELARFVGGTPEDRILSRFQVVWFSPTTAQAEAGARWFRCDLVALADQDRLLRLPSHRRLRGVLDRPGSLNTFGLCGTAQPGARGFERVACALHHSWRAVGTIRLAGGKRYPGTAAVRKGGEDRCAQRVRSGSGLPLKFTYGWEWPTRAQWADGQHYGFCWAPA